MRGLRELLTPPQADVLAKRELEEALRSLLVAQAGREYAEAMCTYHRARIARLRAFLGESVPAPEKR